MSAHRHIIATFQRGGLLRIFPKTLLDVAHLLPPFNAPLPWIAFHCLLVRYFFSPHPAPNLPSSLLGTVGNVLKTQPPGFAARRAETGGLLGGSTAGAGEGKQEAIMSCTRGQSWRHTELGDRTHIIQLGPAGSRDVGR